jgi:hypothetical protein
LSDEQCAAIRKFVDSGGALIATGATSLYNEWGDSRRDFALADLLGAHAPSADYGRNSGNKSFHTYLRLTPELRAKVWGPETGKEPAVSGQRHPVLRGFEETDILPFGGMLTAMRVDAGATVPLTFVPPFPIYPPETAWMRQPTTDVPALILNTKGKARIAYLPADIDRRYGVDNLSDHAHLLANITRWAAGDRLPLEVRGPGFIDCHLYRQDRRLILHLVNLTNEATWRAPMDELIPVGPVEVKVKAPEGFAGKNIELLVSGVKVASASRQGWTTFQVKSIADHEVAVIS